MRRPRRAAPATAAGGQEVAEIHPSPPPVPLTGLVGRAGDLDDVVARVRGGARLLTLTGPGGTGKTRLALAAAAALAPAFPDGVAFVPLAAVAADDLVLPAIGHALGVRESPHRPLAERLAAALRERDVLLVLDNLEHVLGAAPAIAALLASCPRLVVLATSREALRVGGEQRYPVPPLPVPAPGAPLDREAVAGVPAVDLFLQRARQAHPGFVLAPGDDAAIAEIVRRLDGLPLAIELAAARAAALSPTALLLRFDRRLDLLHGGARDLPDRQRTMRGTIAWSYDLLPPLEQAALRRLSVFAGGFTLEAAEAVVHGVEESGRSAAGQASHVRPRLRASQVLDLVTSLIDKSLLRREDDGAGSVRYGMLETIAEYAQEMLTAAGEEPAARAAHAAWSASLAAAADPEIRGADQAAWLARLDREHDNLRAALAWSLAGGDGDPTLGLAIAGNAWMFWYVRGHVSEGRRWLARALALTPAVPGPRRGRALMGAGHLAHYEGDGAAAAALVDAHLDLSRALGDDAGAARSLLMLGIMAEDRGDYAAATPLLDEALPLFERLGDLPFVSICWYHRSVVAYGRGDLALAERLAHDGLRHARAVEDPFSIGALVTHLGLVEADRGDVPAAVAALLEGIDRYRAGGDIDGVSRCLANTAVLAVGYRPAGAARLFGTVERLKIALGYGYAQPEQPRYDRAVADLRRVLGGEAVAAALDPTTAPTMDEAIAEAVSLLEALRTDPSPVAPTPRAPAPAAAAPYGLTPRERDVLRLLVQGRSDREIGRALFISHRTVNRHVAGILARLGVDSRTAAAALAVREGLA